MRLREQENALFARWRLLRDGFVADGAADDAAYTASKIRILFVLKEVNDPGGGGWDLREFMRKGGRSQTWNNITRWIEGIMKLPSDLPWSDVENIDHSRRVRALQSVAAINLKKSPGSHTADSAHLATVASEDRVLLNEQLKLYYNAHLIVCCGVSDMFHSLIDLGAPPAWRRTFRGVWFHEYRPGGFVVSYAHPEARISNNLLYYGLVDAIREITAQQGAPADVSASRPHS